MLQSIRGSSTGSLNVYHHVIFDLYALAKQPLYDPCYQTAQQAMNILAVCWVLNDSDVHH
jgi:hypothetical protein